MHTAIIEQCLAPHYSCGESGRVESIGDHECQQIFISTEEIAYQKW